MSLYPQAAALFPTTAARLAALTASPPATEQPQPAPPSIDELTATLDRHIDASDRHEAQIAAAMAAVETLRAAPAAEGDVIIPQIVAVLEHWIVGLQAHADGAARDIVQAEESLVAAHERGGAKATDWKSDEESGGENDGSVDYLTAGTVAAFQSLEMFYATQFSGMSKDEASAVVASAGEAAEICMQWVDAIDSQADGAMVQDIIAGIVAGGIRLSGSRTRTRSDAIDTLRLTVREMQYDISAHALAARATPY